MIVTYIHHSAFLIELDRVSLLFDYTDGYLPSINPDKGLLVFASHRHGDHFSPVIFEIKEKYPKTGFILSSDISKKKVPEACLETAFFMKPQQELRVGEDGEILITALKSTDEGVAFLVDTEGKTIYHAGDLNNWTWEGESRAWNGSMQSAYRREIEKLAGRAVDVAFLPLDPRQEAHFFLGFDQFMRMVKVKNAFPMHCWGDFSVIGKIKGMDCSTDYRERIMEIGQDGEVFPLED